MKPIMSFWSEPYVQNIHNRWFNEASWNISWLLSVASVTKLYGKPHLYTDTRGAKFLVDTLGLDFASIDTGLDDLSTTNPRLTTQGRAYAISMQTEPFLHVDYDAYLFDPIPEELAKADILFESMMMFDLLPEKIVSSRAIFHRPDLFGNIKGLPECWNKHLTSSKIKVFRTSIVGGSNLEFFRKYAQTILDVANINSEHDLFLIQKAAREKFPDSVINGYVPKYTLDEYLPYAICKEEGLNPRFLTNVQRVRAMNYAHASCEKQSSSDLHGRLLRRVLTSYPEIAAKAQEVIPKKVEIPKITVIVIPDDKAVTVYDAVLRAIIPRNVRPDEIIVSEFCLSENDKKLLSRIDGVRIVPGGKSYMEALGIAFKRSSGKLIVVIDGHVKVPKLYIEKSIAAYMNHEDSVFCTASTDFADKKNDISYGAIRTDYQVAPDLRTRPDDILDMPEVGSLYGGMYVFPHSALELVLSSEDPINNMANLSDEVLGLGYKIRCIKGISVSHNFRQKAQEQADTILA